MKVFPIDHFIELTKVNYLRDLFNNNKWNNQKFLNCLFHKTTKSIYAQQMFVLFSRGKID